MNITPGFRKGTISSALGERYTPAHILLKMIVTVLAIALGLLHYFVIYPLFFSPLSHLPGPKHLKLSRWFILNITRKEQRNDYLQRLHEKYGDVVQVGPHEVAFNSLKHMRDIYMGNFPKEFNENGVGFYSQFGNFGMRNLFSTGNSRTHVARKKPLQKIYSKSNVIQSGSFIKSKIDKVWDQLDAHLGQPIDVYSLFLAMAMDVVSGFEYGSKNSTNFVTEIAHEKGKDCNDVFLGFRESSSMWFYTTLAPQLWEIVAKWENIGKKSSETQTWVYNRFEESLKLLKNGSGVNETNFPLSTVIGTMYQNMVSKDSVSVGGKKTNRNTELPSFRKGEHIDQNETKFNAIASEIADHIAAGHETTGITLTYICWQLSRPCNRHWQTALKKECEGVTDLQELDQLPILNSVIQEACRLHSAIPGSEPRYVPVPEEPENGFFVTLRDGTRIQIPPGTTVSCQPWSLHQSQVFGKDVKKFKPERWLKDEPGLETQSEYEQRIRTMNNHMFTFGQGNRMCLGMHLALIEMKYCVSQLYSRYSTEISRQWCSNILEDDHEIIMGSSHKLSASEDSDIDLMRMADTYTTRPIMDECWLQFSK